MKAAGEKRLITFKGSSLKLTAYFPPETTKAEVQLDDILKVLTEKIRVFLIGGVSQTPYGRVWDEGLLAPGVSRCFSCRTLCRPGRTLKIPRVHVSSGQSGGNCSSLDLICSFSEPPLMLSASQPVLSLPFHQDPHLTPHTTKDTRPTLQAPALLCLPFGETPHSTHPNQKNFSFLRNAKIY